MPATTAPAPALTTEGHPLPDVLADVDEHLRPALFAWITEERHVIAGDDLPGVGEFLDRFAGEFDSFREYADDLADELLDAEGLDADSLARRHFDWEGFARDLILGGDYYTLDAPDFGVYVFRSH